MSTDLLKIKILFKFLFKSYEWLNKNKKNKEFETNITKFGILNNNKNSHTY